MFCAAAGFVRWNDSDMILVWQWRRRLIRFGRQVAARLGSRHERNGTADEDEPTTKTPPPPPPITTTINNNDNNNNNNTHLRDALATKKWEGGKVLRQT